MPSNRAQFTINCVLINWRHLPARLLYNDFGSGISLKNLFPYFGIIDGRIKHSDIKNPVQMIQALVMFEKKAILFNSIVRIL